MVRGEIFRLRARRGARGAEQRGSRFAVVVQADELLALSTVLVSPTSRSATPRSFRPTVEVTGQTTRVLVEQTTAIAFNRLGKSVGRLSSAEMRDLDSALQVVFGL
jgi:mRNA interferase MazF